MYETNVKISSLIFKLSCLTKEKNQILDCFFYQYCINRYRIIYELHKGFGLGRCFLKPGYQQIFTNILILHQNRFSILNPLEPGVRYYHKILIEI